MIPHAPRLAVEDLHARYRDREVLRGIRVRHSGGALVAVVGPNAAGKTTLLRCLAGLLRPTRGAVYLDDRPVHRLPARIRARRIAYVPQRPGLYAPYTVRETVALGRYAAGPDPSAVDTALAQTGLLELAGRRWSELSAGQQQRAVIARALAQLGGPGLLLLDEPTAALDLRHALDTLQVLRARTRSGTLVVATIHDLNLAAAFAQEIWLLDAGRLVYAGPADEALRPRRLAAVFQVGFRHRRCLVPVLPEI